MLLLPSLTLIVAVVLALAPEADAARSVNGATGPPAVRSVTSAAGFEAAVAAMRNSGGTITLSPGTYSTKLRIGPRSSRRLTISGPAHGRAVVRAIVLDHTQVVTIHKLHIRAMARDAGLPVADKPESQDICFVEGGHYADFLTRKFGTFEQAARGGVSGTKRRWSVTR